MSGDVEMAAQSFCEDRIQSEPVYLCDQPYPASLKLLPYDRQRDMSFHKVVKVVRKP